MKSEKKKKVNEKNKPKEKKGRTKRISLYEARLGEFLHAISLINSIEAHWDTQEIILSFNDREKMVPFMFLVDCVFASKNHCPEQVSRN